MGDSQNKNAISDLVNLVLARSFQMTQKVTPQNAQKFLELLKTDLTKTDQLVQYLEAEKSAIQERDFDSYTSLLSKKKHLLIEIESIDRNRQALMADMGFPGD